MYYVFKHLKYFKRTGSFGSWLHTVKYLQLLGQTAADEIHQTLSQSLEEFQCPCSI